MKFLHCLCAMSILVALVGCDDSGKSGGGTKDDAAVDTGVGGGDGAADARVGGDAASDGAVSDASVGDAAGADAAVLDSAVADAAVPAVCASYGAKEVVGGTLITSHTNKTGQECCQLCFDDASCVQAELTVSDGAYDFNTPGTCRLYSGGASGDSDESHGVIEPTR